MNRSYLFYLRKGDKLQIALSNSEMFFLVNKDYVKDIELEVIKQITFLDKEYSLFEGLREIDKRTIDNIIKNGKYASYRL